MKWDGPDSVKSWLISFVCCYIYTIMFGISKLSGVLFVASISRYNVGRQQASFPYTFASAVRNLSGPLVGYLGFKFGVRAVSALGALIGAVAVGACFFAESITLVTYLYGVFFGFGFGLGVNLLPISINQYFDKHRGTASGISFSGVCMGSLILPPIVEILLNNYGLSKTFVFLAGFILTCFPAALLLKKPKYEIERRDSGYEKHAETQSIASSTKKHVYNIKNRYENPKMLPIRKSGVSNLSTIDKTFNENDGDLTHEERLKRLLTETLLSASSDHTSYSEHANNDEIFQHGKERKQEFHKRQEHEIFDLCPCNDHHCQTCKKVDMFDTNICSSQENDKYLQCSSNGRASLNREKTTLNSIRNDLYQNYSCQPDVEEINDSIFSNATDEIKSTKTSVFEHGGKQLNDCSLIQGYQDQTIHSSENVKNSAHYSLENPKSFEFSERKIKIDVNENPEYTENKAISSLRSFSVICDPMFVLIAVTNSIHTFAIVSMMAIIVDFSRDLDIEESNQKYILMLFSVGDIVGRLCVCWITDRGYISTPTFTALCFAGQGIFSAAIAWSTDFISLAALVTLYGSSQASLISVFPVIIAEFIEEDKQTIAIPSSHFLSGPLCLAISPLIGYFRDKIGAYDWIFYLITMVSVASSLSWIFVSFKQKCRRKD